MPLPFREYLLDFSESVKSSFRSYVRIEGRASRTEYWYWFFFMLLGFLLSFIIEEYAIRKDIDLFGWFCLITFLPTVCLHIRRLHDLDYRGWWMLLIIFIPFGDIVLGCLKGNVGSNRFGPDPQQYKYFP